MLPTSRKLVARARLWRRLCSRPTTSTSSQRQPQSIIAVADQQNRPLLLQNWTQDVARSRRFYSSQPADGNNSSANDADPPPDSSDGTLMQIDLGEQTTAPTPIKVPDDFPRVPIIAVHKYPLFPGFLKKIVVQDEELKDVLRRVVRLKIPYVGVFVKRDDENQSETVGSLADIHHVGSFAQILEMRDHGLMVELILSAHRRIRILERISEYGVDDLDQGNSPAQKTIEQVAKLNGRRAKVSSSAAAAKRPEKKISVSGERLVLARTENVQRLAFQRSDEMKATQQAIVQTIRDVVALNPLFGQQINLLLHPAHNAVEDPVYLADLVASLVQMADTPELQAIMEDPNVLTRLDKALLLVQKEKTVAQLKFNINKDVEKKVTEHHRKYLLGEQLKVIKKELGIEKDDKATIQEKLDARIKELKIPEHAANVIAEERQKLNFLDPHSSEFSVIRNYLDWLTLMPWGKTTEEHLDIAKARQVLDSQHYGMKEVKERILEFIAVSSLRGSASGKILCLHGPPGVGKTSIAKSIAAALNRQYFRFSVGGMTDVAEIKGHRRTYVGAMPGKMIQCLKKVATENPLVLIDEVDKIGGAGFHGDPASALLELLDPEQNANFVDHFLDVPVDLSKVLFVCTANVVERIPSALRDRMELLEVSGYVAEEKLAIARDYLIPQARKDTSLQAESLQIADDAISALIRQYCRESGVRSLQKHVEKIFRKAALRIVDGKEQTEEGGSQDETKPKTSTTTIEVTAANVSDFAGRPRFTKDRMYEGQTPIGVQMGLAWTELGGSALYVEAVDKGGQTAKAESDGKEKTEEGAKAATGGTVEATGQLGDVMKESVRTAYTLAKTILARHDPTNDFLHRAHIHLHVPEGATPKDGPSAGCAIASALLSLALRRPVRPDMAMTGEVSLTGQVLPIGGVKEKIIAAKRAGVKLVFLPEDNRRDYDELPDFVKQDVRVVFVAHYDQLFERLFDDRDVA